MVLRTRGPRGPDPDPGAPRDLQPYSSLKLQPASIADREYHPLPTPPSMFLLLSVLSAMTAGKSPGSPASGAGSFSASSTAPILATSKSSSASPSATPRTSSLTSAAASARSSASSALTASRAPASSAPTLNPNSSTLATNCSRTRPSCRPPLSSATCSTPLTAASPLFAARSR
jgi:hypothetical protein